MSLATRRSRITWRCASACFAIISLALGAQTSCDKSRSTRDRPTSSPASESASKPTDSTQRPAESAPPPIKLPEEPDDAARWLVAETPREGAKGGWVEGSFDPARNRIDIRTKDVARFHLDTSRLAIDWDKLVVIEIDGKSAELRHRDNPVIDFEPDGAGHWKVRE